MEYFELRKRQQDYLAIVKAGDVVAVMYSGGYREIRELKVAKTTKTQIVLESLVAVGFRRFRKDDGREIGDGRYTKYEIIDPEWAREFRKQEAELHRRQNLISKLSDVAWRVFDTDELQKMADCLDQIAERKEKSNDAENR